MRILVFLWCTGSRSLVPSLSNMAVEEGEEEKEVSKTGQEKTKLSHKKWRRLLQKEKRRVKRQQLAEKRNKLEEQEKWRFENDSIYRARQEAKERAVEKKCHQEEEESKKQEKLWLEREAQAQIAFTKMKEREEKREREKITQETRIKEDWEKEQRTKKEKEERKKQEIHDKENAVFKELEKPAVQQNTSTAGQWHNPLAPPSQNYGTEQDAVNCSFYLKTGACRFGERCSRAHPRLPASVTLLIPHMYQDIRLSQTMLDEADHDTGLEFDDEEANERYKAFFDDVLAEFEKAGRVVQFKVCCNHEPHLRGNVYVQFSSENETAQAFAAFNGRWYAGRQLSCEYSPVTKWRSAICGFFTRNRCPRGKNCNFLHVYRNPGNAFRNMDRDDSSPGRTPYSERGSERSTRDWSRREVREGSVRDRSYGGTSRREWDYEQNRDRRDRYGRDRERDKKRNGRDRYGRDHEGDRDRERDDRDDRDRERDRERDDRDRERDDRDRERDRERDDRDRERGDRDGERGDRDRERGDRDRDRDDRDRDRDRERGDRDGERGDRDRERGDRDRDGERGDRDRERGDRDRDRQRGDRDRQRDRQRDREVNGRDRYGRDGDRDKKRDESQTLDRFGRDIDLINEKNDRIINKPHDRRSRSQEKKYSNSEDDDETVRNSNADDDERGRSRDYQKSRDGQ
ncbi:hypothetical protein QZH41_016664, partial [Actinostola sp. cb2023]